MSDIETITKNCENWVNNHKGENFLLTYSSVLELLAVLKEQEVKKPVAKTAIFEKDGHHLRCSNCDEYFCSKDCEGNVFPQKYCPNCGAKME